jgi:hypothetical protein
MHRTLASNPVFDAQKQDNINIETMINDLAKQMRESVDDSLLSESNQYFDEEFDIDVEFEQYERIEVPNFSHGRRGRFVHDFAKVCPREPSLVHQCLNTNYKN